MTDKPKTLQEAITQVKELSAFGSAFAAANKSGQKNFPFNGKSYTTDKASDGPKNNPGLSSASPQFLRPRPAETKWIDPVSAGKTADKPAPSGPAPVATATPKPVTAPASGNDKVDFYGAEKKVPAPTMSLGTSDAAASARTGDVPKPADPGAVENAKRKGNTLNKEETNPLIAAFLKLQSENPSNMFEAAKKLSKKQDEKLDVVDDDKIDAKDFAALRAGKKGKMEEGNIDPVVTGSSSVTKSKTGYVDPSTPTEPYKKSPVSTAAGDVLDKAKNALDKKGVQQEEVSFSESELAYFASIDEVGAPVSPTAKKTSANDVKGDTVDKRDLNDDVECIGEAMPAPVIASKQKYADMSDEDFAAKHGNKSEKDLRDMAARHGYGWNKTTKTGSDHYVKRVAKAKQMEESATMTALAAGSALGAAASPYINKAVGKGLDWLEKKRKQKNQEHYEKKSSKDMKEETLEEGRPKKNPTPETTDRDPRQHIQVMAGRAAAGNVLDFKHENGKTSKLTPGMGRKITSHLNTLKPADRQAAVNKMHASPEGLKV